MSIVIRAIGKSVPKKRLFNSELPAELDTNDEWIRSHTGIKSRYVANTSESCLSMGTDACKEALTQFGLAADKVDLIICSTTSPAYQGFPSTACVMQKDLNAVNATCFDISAACSGFLYGLNIAKGLMETNQWKYALVCGSEHLTKLCDWSDRSTCILFGDGAGAVLLENTFTENSTADKSNMEGKICNFVSGSDGTGCMALYMDPQTNLMKMDGHAVYNFAVGIMQNAIQMVMEQENLNEAQVDYFVCHQANERILSSAAKRLGYDINKFVFSMDEYGNTSSASIPITLYDMYKAGKIKKGTTIVSAAFGAGLTWAGTAIKF